MLEFVSRLTVIAASLIISMPPAPATESAAANKAAVENVLKAWMTGDSGALQQLLSDDVEWTITGNSLAAGTTHGRAELISAVLGPFGARFALSQDRFRPRHIGGIYADGDVVVANFDGAGVANDGKPYTNSYVWLLTMRNGKVLKATAFFDSIAFDELWQRVPPARN
jgi:ketosteroid isomerase-like protein